MFSTFLTLDEIHSEYMNLAGGDEERDVSISKFREFGSGFAEKLAIKAMLSQRIALIKIVEHQGLLPKGFRSVVQLGVNPNCNLNRNEIVQVLTESYTGAYKEVDFISDMKCPHCGLNDCSHTMDVFVMRYEDRFAANNPGMYRSYLNDFYSPAPVLPVYKAVHPFHEQKYRHLGYEKRFRHHSDFFLMEYRRKEFFNASHHIPQCVNLSVESIYQYDMELPWINTNVREGWLILSYLGHRLDKYGYYTFPGYQYAIDAIIAGVKMSVADKLYSIKQTSASEAYYKNRQADYVNKMELAKEKLKSSTNESWYSFLRNQWMSVYQFNRPFMVNGDADMNSMYNRPFKSFSP